MPIDFDNAPHETVELSVRKVREDLLDLINLGDDLARALDKAQGAVFLGKAKEAYVIIRITEE